MTWETASSSSLSHFTIDPDDFQLDSTATKLWTCDHGPTWIETTNDNWCTSDNAINLTYKSTTNFTMEMPNSGWLTHEQASVNIGNGEDYWEHWRVQTADSQFTVWAEAVHDRVRRNVERSRRVRETDKGLTLLRTILNDEEWADYRRHKSVRVLGSDARVYEVGNGNLVYLIGIDGKATEARCWHVPYSFCAADRIAGAVLALKTDASAFERQGNVNRLQPHEAERVQARRAFGRRAA